jgi:hypothetical protein
MITQGNDERKRTWLLIYSEEEDLKTATDSILELNKNADLVDAKNYVVRADVVSGPFNIVVPVVATDPERMERIIGEIKNLNPIVKEIVAGEVEYPNPPDFGYGDGDEGAYGPDKHNEWG